MHRAYKAHIISTIVDVYTRKRHTILPIRLI